MRTPRARANHPTDYTANHRFPSLWWRSEQVGRCDDEIAVIADHLDDRAA